MYIKLCAAVYNCETEKFFHRVSMLTRHFFYILQQNYFLIVTVTRKNLSSSDEMQIMQFFIVTCACTVIEKLSQFTLVRNHFSAKISRMSDFIVIALGATSQWLFFNKFDCCHLSNARAVMHSQTPSNFLHYYVISYSICCCLFSRGQRKHKGITCDGEEVIQLTNETYSLLSPLQYCFFSLSPLSLDILQPYTQ